MRTEKNNFQRVIEWLRANGYIRSQKDLAERIGTTETTITRNKKGNVRRFEEDTLIKFNAVFGNIINIAYLRGESDTMLVGDLSSQEKIKTGVMSATSPIVSPAGSITPDSNSFMNALLTAKDEIIASLRSQLADKETIVELKDRYINILQQQLSALHKSQESSK